MWLKGKIKKMEEKVLKVLGENAKYDSSGFTRKIEVENYLPFIYPATGEKGRICNLFKILLTNNCKSNCLYCVNRKNRDCPRYSLSPYRLAEIFYQFWKKRYVEGLFLSSAIEQDTNETQEKIIKTAEILRKRYEYKGYIHLKILPGADPYLIRKASIVASRISLNMEAPSTGYLSKISREKDFSKNLLKTLKYISKVNKENSLPAGITTQFVVGAAGEKDKEILGFSYYLYKNHNLKRIYYSRFIPVINTPLENLPACNPQREVRLYQADILIRRYGFTSAEIPYDEKGNLILEKDPKLLWAEKNPSFFPVEINKASFEELIRVPGIGFKSAKKIIGIRKENTINSPSQLKKLRIRLNIACQFLLFNGKKRNLDEKVPELKEEQLLLWDEI